MFETLLSLLISVLLVRTFLVEGYLISTGSMAPHLFGSHKKNTCPQCHTDFAVGTEFDRSMTNQLPEQAVCPNCLYEEIEIQNRPVDRGDHLLVWKNAFDFREPRRWEVVVFRNPNDPLETFIKRVAGLPGERIEVRDGNLFINGKLIRKTLDEQRALLLPVFDASRVPSSEDPAWIPRWSPALDNSNWSRAEPAGSWHCASNPDVTSAADSLTYRHSLRSGGDHITTVGLFEPLTPAQRAAFEPSADLFPLTPEPPFPGVHFVEATNSLTCRGVMTNRVYHQLIAVDQTPSFTAAIERLRTASRIAPVNDFEAYNEHSPVPPENEISEFFLSFFGQFESSAGSFTVTLAVPGARFSCRFDLDREKVTLEEVSSGKILRTGTFQLNRARDEFFVEFSGIDRQLCLAIDGTEAFEPWELPESVAKSKFPSEIASLGDVRGTFGVRELVLSRDVFYTSRYTRHAVGEQYQLGPEEFFMLGDNSSVSSDSRMWERAAVPSKLLVGKPFAVHLPSRTVRMGSTDSAWQIRLPDISRIRFVR